MICNKKPEKCRIKPLFSDIYLLMHNAPATYVAFFWLQFFDKDVSCPGLSLIWSIYHESYKSKASDKMTMVCIVPCGPSMMSLICAHYSCFENMGLFVILKKSGPNMGCKKQGAKNRDAVIQKEKKPDCLFSFWITDHFA